MLKIRSDQVDALLRANQRPLVSFISEHMVRERPQLMAGVEPESLRALILQGLARARSHGLTKSISLAVFVAFMLEVSPSFFLQPQFAAILVDSSVSEHERLAALLDDALIHAWIAAERAYDVEGWDLDDESSEMEGDEAPVTQRVADSSGQSAVARLQNRLEHTASRLATTSRVSQQLAAQLAVVVPTISPARAAYVGSDVTALGTLLATAVRPSDPARAAELDRIAAARASLQLTQSKLILQVNCLREQLARARQRLAVSQQEDSMSQAEASQGPSEVPDSTEGSCSHGPLSRARGQQRAMIAKQADIAAKRPLTSAALPTSAATA